MYKVNLYFCEEWLVRKVLFGIASLEAVGPNERNDRLGSAKQNGFLRQKDEDPI
jgi:hypothetical protein